MKRLLLALCLLPAFAVAQTAAPAVQPTVADKAFQSIYQTEWTWRTQQSSGGDEDGDPNAAARNRSLPDVSPQAQANKLAYLEGVLKQLDGVNVRALSAGEQLNYAIYRPQIEHTAAALRFRDYEMPFNSDSSFWSNLDFMARAELRDAAAYHAYAARLRDVPRYFDQQIANMRAGLARGFSVPRAVLDGRDDSIAMTAHLKDPEAASLWTPYTRMPSTIPAAEQAALRERLGLAMDEVAFMGDDLPDLPVLRRVGFAVAPAGAHRWLGDAVHWTTPSRGGEGAARELADLILQAQGRVDGLLGGAAP